MTDPLLLAQIVGLFLYLAAALSSSYTSGRTRSLGLAWLALLIAIAVTSTAAIGEYWIASVLWGVTCGLAVYRVVQEEQRSARRG